MTFFINDFRPRLDRIMTDLGLDPNCLKVVECIKVYCAEIGHSEYESSENRLAKCIHSNPPLILLRNEITGNLHVDGIRPMALREFDNDLLSALDDPFVFSAQLLVHEIAHFIRRDLHLNMVTGDIELDCDRWAFDYLAQNGLIK